MLWIPEKSSPRREHLSSPESTATLAGGGVSGQWVQNLLRSKVTTSSHGTWNSGEERTGLSQVALGGRNLKGSGLGGRGACIIAPYPPHGRQGFYS